MSSVLNTVISPVNVEERRKLQIKPGDTIKVHQKIKEKAGFRIQIFEGTVIAVKHGKEAGATFTVRRTSGGYGIEKTYPLYSPMIDKIEIARRAKVRRAKLYYIRDKAMREIRRQMRRMRFVNVATEGEAERTEREKLEAEAAEKEAAEEAKKQEAAAAENANEAAEEVTGSAEESTQEDK